MNSDSPDGFPNISADGLSLFFASDRPGGLGDNDLWVATRQTTAEPFSTVQHLGSNVNTALDDWGPSISADGLILVFNSNRPGGLGGHDLWVATRRTTSSPFDPAVNLGPKVNSDDDDAKPYLSPDGSALYFMSTRPGGSGFFDIWVVPIVRTVSP